MKITFKEIPYTGDEDSFNFCDVGADRQFEIIVDDTYTVGCVYISENYEAANGREFKTYINWIEFFIIYQGKSLLRPVMTALSKMFGDLYFETDEENEQKYRRIGCYFTEKDDCTELPIYVFLS